MGIRSRRAGFTLVELLVVIGIIALLVAILMPALTAARQQAQTTQCASNLKQAFMALNLYAMDYNGLIPPNQSSPGIAFPRVTSAPGTVYPYWPNFLSPVGQINFWLSGNKNYLGNVQVLNCPLQERSTANPGLLRGSYGLNVRMYTPKPSDNPRWLSRDIYNNVYFNLQKTRAPSEIFLMADTSMNVVTGSNNPQLNYANGEPRHRQNVLNMLFVDGHVDRLRKVSVAATTDGDTMGTEVYYRRPWFPY